MNIIPLTAIILAAALTSNLAASQKASKPCTGTGPESAYDSFDNKHILKDNSLHEKSEPKTWTKYLKDKKLLGRVKLQSFIKASEKTVQQICGDSGRHLRDNLCISKSSMVVYGVESTKVKVTKVTKGEHNVIVACNLIKTAGNPCRPVHYEAYRGEKPGNLPCKSGP